MPFTMLALAGYAATIASFLGGIHWGLAMRDTAHARLFPYIWGAIPSVLASIAVIMPPWAGLVVLGLLLAGCYAVDRRLYVYYHMQGWLQLRLRLTVVASLAGERFSLKEVLILATILSIGSYLIAAQVSLALVGLGGSIGDRRLALDDGRLGALALLQVVGQRGLLLL